MVFVFFVACSRPADQVIVVHTVGGASTTVVTTTTTSSVPDPDGPRLRTVEVTEGPTVLEVRLTLREGAAPLDGGVVHVDYDETALSLRIPEDLTTWDGTEATFLLDRPMFGLCTEGAVHDLGVEVVDARDRRSATVAAEIATTDVGLIVDEIGESLLSLVGFATPGLLICGTLDSTGHTGADYTADLDFVGFAVDPTEQWTVRLDWDETANYDLLLYQRDADGYMAPIDQAIRADVHGPELLTRRLYRDEQYMVGVGGWSGAAGEWSLTFE